MEIRFTSEQETQISENADHHGINAEQFVKQAALRIVEEEEEFRAGVQRGIEQADRGEFIEHDEVKVRISRLLPLE